MMRSSIAHRTWRVSIAAVGLMLAGCSGEPAANASAKGGTLVAALAAEPDMLLPPLMVVVQNRTVADLVFDQLARMGDSLNTIGDAGFVPELAKSWTWASDSLSIAFHLDPKAQWHDGVPVRASDIRFTFDVSKDPQVGAHSAPTLARIDSVTAPDSLTAVVWYARRYPEQFFDAVNTNWIIPEHALKGVARTELKSAPFTRQPIGSGRFRFARWDAGTRLEIVADTANYRGRPNLDRVIFTFSASTPTGLAQLAAGEIDLLENVRADQAAELASKPNVQIVRSPSFVYSYVQFNFRDRRDRKRPHPLLGDRAMREAISHAIDRETLVRGVLGDFGRPGIGPMTRAQALADSTLPQLAYDTTRAAAILDSLGWRKPAGGGVRTKNGRPLHIDLLIPTVSPGRMRMSVPIQEQLRQAGVDLTLVQLDAQAWTAKARAHDFDLLFAGHTAEASMNGLRTSWSGTVIGTPNDENLGSYANPKFDAQFDSAMVAMSYPEAKTRMRAAMATMAIDVPAMWMYEPVTAIAVHKRFRTKSVLPTGWWTGIADWSVPVAERIPRDRAGLATASR
jgi:peptide/nickel transport system substrate-binding protein